MATRDFVPRGDNEGNIGSSAKKWEGGNFYTVNTDKILPITSGTATIGAEDNKFKAVYADEVHISQDTLYINGTPVLGTDKNDSINVKADSDQSLIVSTTGLGSTQVTSEKNVDVVAKGSNGAINVTASGTNSSINMAADNGVNITAANISLSGTTNVDNLVVTGTTTTVNSENLTVKDNIIEINSGETGNGVTKGSAGLKVNRGEELPYLIEFDESEDMFKVGMQGDLETIASQNYVDTKASSIVNGTVSRSLNMANLAKIKRSTAYAVGDITFHDSLPSWAYLECITAGTTAATEPSFFLT